MNNTSRNSGKAGAQLKRYHTVLSHRFHLDEVIAFVLLLLFGDRKGIDISEADIQLIKNNRLPDGKTVGQLDREGYLVIGEGDGRFDEHGRPDAEETCAALLVAKYLGVDSMKGLVTLLAEIRDFDRNPEATKTCLANLMKECFTARRRTVEDVIGWAIEAATDMVKWHMNENSTLVEDAEAYNAVFMKAWADAADRKVWDQQMYDRAMKDFAMSFANERKLFTELSNVYFYQVAISGKEEADKWLTEAAFDMIRYQELWFKSRDEFLKNASVMKTTALVDGAEKEIRIAAIRSDSEVMNSVYRSTEAVKRFGRLDVLVQKRSSGNVGVFLNHKSRLFCDDLARMVRWAELDLSGRRPRNWEGLARGETVDAVPEWYYHRTSQVGRSALYNGSLTHPRVIPTRISEDGLLDMLFHAFHPDGVRMWRRKHDAYDVPARRHEPRKEAKQGAQDAKVSPEIAVSLQGVVLDEDHNNAQKSEKL